MKCRGCPSCTYPSNPVPEGDVVLFEHHTTPRMCVLPDLPHSTSSFSSTSDCPDRPRRVPRVSHQPWVFGFTPTRMFQSPDCVPVSVFYSVLVSDPSGHTCGQVTQVAPRVDTDIPVPYFGTPVRVHQRSFGTSSEPHSYVWGSTSSGSRPAPRKESHGHRCSVMSPFGVGLGREFVSFFVRHFLLTPQKIPFAPPSTWSAR